MVSEYLWWRGLDHVDYLLASHADADHIDGLNDVVRNFAVRAILVARTPSHDAEYSRLMDASVVSGVHVYTIGAGDVLRIGSVESSVLWPTALSNSDSTSTNNDSALLRIKFGDKAILFTGDIEAAAETVLVEMFDSDNNSVGPQRADGLRADVVKVAHHGSKTSSTARFISATQARLAIISVGQTSMFGHPHPEVVKRWKASGADVMTTGEQGTITVRTDGRELSVETFFKR